MTFWLKIQPCINASVASCLNLKKYVQVCNSFWQLGFDLERLIRFTFGLDYAFTSLQFIWQLGFDLERLIGF